MHSSSVKTTAIQEEEGEGRRQRKRQGFEKMIKDINDSKHFVNKVKGGTMSIFEDPTVKDSIKASKSVAPILSNENFKSNFQNIVTVAASECNFQRKVLPSDLPQQEGPPMINIIDETKSTQRSPRKKVSLALEMET